MERACCNRTVWSTIERVCGSAAIATAFRARSRWQIMTHLLQARCQGNRWTQPWTNVLQQQSRNHRLLPDIHFSYATHQLVHTVHCQRRNFLKLRMIYRCARARWHSRHYRFWFIPFRWILVQHHLSSKSSPVCEWLMISAIFAMDFSIKFLFRPTCVRRTALHRNNNKSKTCKEPSLLYSRVPRKIHNTESRTAFTMFSLSYFHELQNGSPYGTWDTLLPSNRTTNKTVPIPTNK